MADSIAEPGLGVKRGFGRMGGWGLVQRPPGPCTYNQSRSPGAPLEPPPHSHKPSWPKPGGTTDVVPSAAGRLAPIGAMATFGAATADTIRAQRVIGNCGAYFIASAVDIEDLSAYAVGYTAAFFGTRG